MTAAPDVIVYRARRVLTMNSAAPRAEWIAVGGGSILDVGRGAPPTGDIVDLGDVTVLPGFHDAHVHPPLGGLAMIRCDLHGLATPADYVAAVGEYARAHPEERWILGGGWAMDAFPGGVAMAADLDAVVPDRPVFLHSREGHAAWANSMALALAGITASTPDPPHGRLERDGEGAPTGTLQEGAADLVERVAPRATVADYVRAIAAAQDLLLSHGITGWQDAWVTQRIQHAYLQLAARRGLVATVRGALWWDRERGVEQLDDLIARSREGAARFRPTSIKLMVDGVCENGTAAMRRPFVGTDSTGIQFIPREILLEAVPRIMAAGLQPHFHAIGDRAIGDALDAVAAGDPGDVRRVRPHIAHVQVIDPIDLPRFARLGVAANAQAYWACHDDCMTRLTIPRLGAARAAHQYPFRALLDSDAHLAAGSDWAVSTADPFAQIAVAVTRTQPGHPDPFLADQAVSVGEMLTAFTQGSAWVNHEEARRGSLEPGKAADFIVVDADPLTTVPDRLAAIRVLTTFVSGRRVFGG